MKQEVIEKKSRWYWFNWSWKKIALIYLACVILREIAYIILYLVEG